MNSTSIDSADGIRSSLRPALPGLFFAVLTLLYGFLMGVAFGINEDGIKTHLKDSALEVRETVYQSDDDELKAVTDKSWAYMKRAHLHAGGLGATAVALTLLVVMLGVSAKLTAVVSLALGLGGLWYSVFWMWAGFRAPALGSTSLAKQSLDWLAVTSSGAVVLSTAIVAVVVVVAIFRQPTGSSQSKTDQ